MNLFGRLGSQSGSLRNVVERVEECMKMKKVDLQPEVGEEDADIDVTLRLSLLCLSSLSSISVILLL